MLDHIYGQFNKPKNENDRYEQLWHKLAPQYEDDTMKVLVTANLGMTQKKHEIIELWQLFDRMQPHVILEIGIAQGGTFAGWCQLAPDDALIIGIDRNPDDCNPRAGGHIIHRDIDNRFGCLLVSTSNGGGAYRLKRRESNQRIEIIKGWSYEETVMKRLLEVLDGKKIDWIFHDASHSEEMTSKDYELYWPLVSPGGAMAFHDISYSSVPEVSKWKWWRKRYELKLNYYVCYSYEMGVDQSMGIGVLFKFPERGKC
jgi:predicted O-methyltransferase YrrM